METQNEDQREIGASSETTKDKRSGFRKIGKLIRKNWPKYVIEIFVIIIGITLSFIIDNQKEEAARKALEEVYIKNLLIDMEKDVSKLENVIQESEMVINSSKRLLKLSSLDNADINVKQFGSDFGRMLTGPKFISSDATFADLKSGNTHLINSTKLRAFLFEYYSFYERIKIEEKIQDERLVNIYQPFLYGNFFMKGFDDVGERIFLPNNNDWKILKSNMFLNVASSRVLDGEGLKNSYESALVLAKGIKTNLEEEIN